MNCSATLKTTTAPIPGPNDNQDRHHAANQYLCEACIESCMTDGNTARSLTNAESDVSFQFDDVQFTSGDLRKAALSKSFITLTTHPEMKNFAEGPWSRPAKIILGIDIGTTQSAVSFAYLYPGGPQSLHRVTAWPGQKSQKEESKIPTLVYYDSDHNAVSFGAEALKPAILERAEDEKWQLARHFKIHLHTESMQQIYNLRAQPLPFGIPLLKIYTDFMAYLLKHTKAFFESHIIDGARVWSELHKDMTIVLAHPNGWGLKEQNFLRQAAVAARFVPSEKAVGQVQFVSEAEASVHFCMFHGDLHNRFSPSTTFVVCDAGGSTIDTTAYLVKSTSPILELEERKASACVQAGGVYVDIEFEMHLARVLNGIGSLDHEELVDYIKRGVKDFEEVAKREFDDSNTEYRIDLGAGRLTKPELRIRRGTIILDDATIKPFFEDCVTQAVANIRQQMLGISCRYILLVGGLGDSPYLRNSLISEFSGDKCAVSIANDSTAKAVADGAVIWCAKLSVTSRATRMPYGVGTSEKYNPRNVRHSGRATRRSPCGYDLVSGKWSQIVAKGTVMNSEEAVREMYWRAYETEFPHLGDFLVGIYSSINDRGDPNYWLDDEKGNLNRGFEKVCVIKTDLSLMRGALAKHTGRDGNYWVLEFTVALQFGGTELRAFVEWEQDGKTRAGPVSIIPDALTGAQSVR